MFTFYEVGGKVRDELLGLKSKDVDYVAVPNEKLLNTYSTAAEMFTVLANHLAIEKFEIFLQTSACYTIRAKFPKHHKYQGIADFVMARKELGYITGTRTPIIKPGTLYDDLERRDFTINAMAKGEDGKVIDYFNGLDHINSKLLITPIDTSITFDDDPLRILRAIRFAITKDFIIPMNMHEIILNYDYTNKMNIVSIDRIREELYKCFKHNTELTIEYLNMFPALKRYIFKNNILWLKPTTKNI